METEDVEGAAATYWTEVDRNSKLKAAVGRQLATFKMYVARAHEIKT
jgi:hypothetical protein